MSSRKKQQEPAAAAAPAKAAAPAAGEQREPDYTWGGRPVFKCHAAESCKYERVGNLQAVLAHELLHEQAREKSVRESRILGTDGQPIKVEEER